MERLSDDTGLFSNFAHRKKIPVRTDIQKEPPSPNVRKRLHEEQKGLCKGCETHLDIIHLTLDHIIPKSKGGGDYYDNYQLLCANCNSVKGNRTMEYLMDKIRKRKKHLKLKVTFGGI